MGKKVHHFEDSYKAGKIGERIMDRYFGKYSDIDIKEVTLQMELDKGVDRLFINKKNGRRGLVEYKTDNESLNTGNFFMEVTANNRKDKKGWLLYSEAVRLVILSGKIIYSVKMKEIRKHIEENGHKYKLRPCHNPTYDSMGRCMPIEDIHLLKSLMMFNIED